MRRIASLLITLFIIIAILPSIPDLISGLADFVFDSIKAVGNEIRTSVSEQIHDAFDWNFKDLMGNRNHADKQNPSSKPADSGGGNTSALNGNAKELSVGSRGEQVEDIQRRLAELGYHTDSCDGIFGAKTKASVEAFQKAMGIEVSGIVDKTTLNRMEGLSLTLKAEDRHFSNHDLYTVRWDCETYPYSGCIRLGLVEGTAYSDEDFIETIDIHQGNPVVGGTAGKHFITDTTTLHGGTYTAIGRLYDGQGHLLAEDCKTVQICTATTVKAYELGSHPHGKAVCKTCGKSFQAKDLGYVGRVSDCDVCFSRGDYTIERAREMAELANEAYEMEEWGTGTKLNRLEIADDNRDNFQNAKFPTTEALVTTSLTADGQLILSISFEGSQDLKDDWIRDFVAGAKDGVHLGVSRAMSRFANRYIYHSERLIDVNMPGSDGPISNGSHKLKTLLDIVRDTPGAQLCITGHSYGGGLAQCFTVFAIETLGIAPEKIETYTFASLVPFTDKFIMDHPILHSANIYNFIDIRDVVPDFGVTSEVNWADYDTDTEALKSLHENLVNVLGDKYDGIALGGYTLSGCNAGRNVYIDSGKDRDLIYTLSKIHVMSQYRDLLKKRNPVIGEASAAQIVAGKIRYELETRFDTALAVHKNSTWNVHSKLTDYNLLTLCQALPIISAQMKAEDSAVADVGICSIPEGWDGDMSYAGDVITNNGMIQAWNVLESKTIRQMVEKGIAAYEQLTGTPFA